MTTDTDLEYLKTIALDLSARVIVLEHRCTHLEGRADHAEKQVKLLRTNRLHNHLLMGNVKQAGGVGAPHLPKPRQLDES